MQNVKSQFPLVEPEDSKDFTMCEGQCLELDFEKVEHSSDWSVTLNQQMVANVNSDV